MDIQARIAAELAKPNTHRVVTTYACGKTVAHDTKSLAQAENWAVGESRKLGRDLIDRETKNAVRVIDVTISAIQ